MVRPLSGGLTSSWGSCEPSAGHFWARHAWLRWTLADACGRDFGVDWVMHVLSGVTWLGVKIGRFVTATVAAMTLVPE